MKFCCNRDEIVNAVQENRVILIAGDTGCGKSTQIPQYVLKGGFKKIGIWYEYMYVYVL